MPSNEFKNPKVGSKIKPTTTPKKEIGVDQNNKLFKNIIEASTNNVLDMSKLEGFSLVNQSREQLYKSIDTMFQDSTIASIGETYAEDVVQANDKGKIIWAESQDAKCSKYINYLIDSLNIEKYLYSWAYSLVKYGDIYVRLYRKSETSKEELFDVNDAEEKATLRDVLNENLEVESGKKLDENVKMNIRDKKDHYDNYVEMVPNPGEMFELTHFGKVAGYIKAPITILTNYTPQSNLALNYMSYKVKKKDIEIFSALDFAHGYLSDNSSRTPEEVDIFLADDKIDEKTGIHYTYQVRRGQSLFYNTFKIWRELNLLENSLLLNRVTKSSIFRLIQVEVGDMSGAKVQQVLNKIKNMLEQKSAFDTGNGTTEYTNPGSIENNIYLPTHEGKGAVTINSLGGEVDPKQLTDLDWFNNRLFGGLKIPKHYFGFTDDAAGFNGGSSLSIISSRYGKSVKRIQQVICQVVTDISNMYLIDRGLKSFINKFTIRMQAPITQEEIDRKDAISNSIRNVTDIMNTLSDVENASTKLIVLKSLLSSVLPENEELLTALQEEIKSKKKEQGDGKDEDLDFPKKSGGGGLSHAPTSDRNNKETEGEEISPIDDLTNEVGAENEPTETENEEEAGTPEENKGGSYLPTPNELNQDMTKNK